MARSNIQLIRKRLPGFIILSLLKHIKNTIVFFNFYTLLSTYDGVENFYTLTSYSL